MGKLPSLNGLRAVSILIVILFHLSRFNLYVDQDTILRIPIFNGRFGVNVFFVISGFLITYLLLQEEERAGAISLKNFYIRRVLRIFPAYFFLLFVYFLLQEWGYLDIPRMAWVTALTYTKYLNYHLEFYTSHAWSLSIEENFYLFWPVIFLLGKKLRGYVVFGIIVMVPFFRLFLFYHPISWIDEQSLFTRMDSIAMGCFVALHRNKIIARLSPYWKDAFLYAVILLFLWPWLEGAVEGTPAILLFVLLGPLTGTVANVCISVIILYSVYGPRGGWYKVLNTKAFNFIGILSYSLYLWQQLFIARNHWWVTHFPQCLLCIFGAALFSYYLIETPFLRLKAKFSGKKSRINTTVTTTPEAVPAHL
jgi:peptidoglycan/LPS O-acetylase OafA/YrhL